MKDLQSSEHGIKSYHPTTRTILKNGHFNTPSNGRRPCQLSAPLSTEVVLCELLECKMWSFQTFIFSCSSYLEKWGAKRAPLTNACIIKQFIQFGCPRNNGVHSNMTYKVSKQLSLKRGGDLCFLASSVEPGISCTHYLSKTNSFYASCVDNSAESSVLRTCQRWPWLNAKACK